MTHKSFVEQRRTFESVHEALEQAQPRTIVWTAGLKQRFRLSRYLLVVDERSQTARHPKLISNVVGEMPEEN